MPMPLIAEITKICQSSSWNAIWMRDPDAARTAPVTSTARMPIRRAIGAKVAAPTVARIVTTAVTADAVPADAAKP